MKLYQSYLKCLSKDNTNGICSVIQDTVCSLEDSGDLSLRKSDIIEYDLKIKLINIVRDKGWYSGHTAYPIDSGRSDLKNPMTAYDLSNLWDPDTEYGLRRIYIANELANYIKSKGY